MDKIIKYKKIYLKSLSKPGNIQLFIESAVKFVSLWNPVVGAILQTILSMTKFGISVDSTAKVMKRTKMIIEIVDRIISKQKSNESNYEAALICPELFRNALIFTDSKRAEEHLELIELLFSEGKIDFDRMAEASDQPGGEKSF